MALMLDNCEGIMLSLDSHKSVPAPFLTKTYQLVDDPSTDHIVSWGEDDTTFVVWRPPEFARDLLPNYFKHNNFSSFVRQLNTYGFRKIVPDRWEFANEFFKKGEKHLLCEIHRRKTSHQPHIPINHHHNLHHQHSQISCGGGGVPTFFPFSSRVSISPSDSDEQANWCDSSPLSSPSGGGGGTAPPGGGGGFTGGGGVCTSSSSSVTALSEDNERLRQSNSMLLSELAHMRKLYNDIIYFVQNHVRPVAPSNSYPSSHHLLLSNNNNPPSSSSITTQPCVTSNNNTPMMVHQKPLHQLLGLYHHHSTTPPKQAQQQVKGSCFNSSSSNSSTTALSDSHQEPNNNNNSTSRLMKLFGVPLHSKKRLHPEPMTVETNKARLVLSKGELGLNLMPSSPC
ncbi:heat stress transcription factor B-4-like [Macadamia integrifolia]|uniref:heat stress transcription factor B-4-like n=1 Tax=Macadamia integrifolia TaxID=60698 RepID=UPI001C52E4D7|nr:heat stress transcription factor B-4-like [Macadamia integrifolia]